MDSTLIATIPAIIDIINEDMGLNINHLDVHKWNFEDVISLDEEYISSLFENWRFFKNVKLFPDVREVLQKHKYRFNYTVVTKGSPINLKKKEKWVKKFLPEVDKFVGLEYNGCMDKSSAEMGTGSIFLDDNQDCLFSSNADIKVMMFEKERGICDWNDRWDGLKVNSWKEFDKFLEGVE